MVDIPSVVVDAGLGAGPFREYMSRLQNRVPKTKSGHRSGSFDILSAIGEAFFLASYPNRRWTWRPVGSDKKERDVGDCEVEATRLPNKNLILREKDMLEGVDPFTPYVLVWLEETDASSSGWRGALVGWMRLWEGIEHPRAGLLHVDGIPRRGKHLVPHTLLHPMPDPDVPFRSRPV